MCQVSPSPLNPATPCFLVFTHEGTRDGRGPAHSHRHPSGSRGSRPGLSARGPTPTGTTRWPQVPAPDLVFVNATWRLYLSSVAALDACLRPPLPSHFKPVGCPWFPVSGLGQSFAHLGDWYDCRPISSHSRPRVPKLPKLTGTQQFPRECCGCGPESPCHRDADQAWKDTLEGHVPGPERNERDTDLWQGSR